MQMVGNMQESHTNKIMQKATIASEHTAQRISKTITFYKNESKAASMLQQNGPKPLLLLLPWLGSQPHTVDKYREIYFRQGFDVLTVESETSHFLWPRWGLDYGAQVLDLLQSDSFVSRPLLLHAFSIGGYTFAQMMVHMSNNTEQYKSVTDRIKGQIYDSLVIGSVERMATGVCKIFSHRLQGLVRWSILFYFRALDGYTVDCYNAALNVYWNNPLQIPALFFYCENDPVSDQKELDRLIKCWQQKGISVTYKAWKDSRHAGHLRQHPQEYLVTLHRFLQSLNMAQLKAKM
ncbi:transmembrane protein 53-B-like isoform X3 [Polyodon spathula]|uniref:transmembrane protein 53-B-like isoform X3 n=1 Tax=Polyodon spathula TaxID=7913 RepID=UPI001B7DBD99|nr:transmembrane protein 53-B-like isoform X3 [Polyodon spathula]